MRIAPPPFPLTLAALLCATLLAGCSSSAGPSGALTGSQALLLERGSGIGYVVRAGERDERRVLDVDFIRWFTGSGAEIALREDDPACEKDERGCAPPNGYYVRNRDQSSERLTLSDDARFLLQTRDPSERFPDEEVTLQQFLSAVLLPDGRVAERFRFVPFWITRTAGLVTEVREQYVP